MAVRKINSEYISYYDEIILTQPLVRGYSLYQHFRKNSQKWKVIYTTNSPFSICPWDGMERKCIDCDGNEDENCCFNHQQILSSRVVCNRVNDCIKAGLEVKFIDNEVNE